ncbi:MAG: hypothetical protein M1827_003182 [Pycnora praestabilis]|nr:MAG: hypothetical protein M1827_003182 [Pycnora praestabilis]
MEKGYADRQSEWRKLWEEGVSILKDEGWATVGYTWVLAKWAATILSSRSFISSLLVEIISDDHPTGQWNLAPKADGPFPVLFPLIDILNHRPKAKVSWETGREFMGLVIGEELHSGDLVWNNYGPKSNEELLLGYGFCLPSNPFDQVAIKLNMPSNPNHSAIRNQQSSYINSIVSPNETPPDGYYYIRSPDHYTSGYENVSAELRAFPPSLIDNLSILVANDREMGLLQKRPNLHWPTLNGGRRNMLALICQLLQVLQRKYNEITWFDHLLPKDPTNDKQRNAKIYRDSQISIIRAAINPLMYKLRGAVEIGDHGEVIPQLVTLEKALKYLKSLDKVTYTSFRRGLKLALGTNDIRELREACWAEGVWTLWICTIRLWFLRQASAIRINSTVEAKEPLRTKLIDWIRFTDDLQYWSSDPLFDVTATESANDDEAAAELLSVVKSAAEADPSSVFAERIWDLTFIKRGNRIGMEEGLTLALQEQDTEVGEQYVLHLEKRKLQTNTLHG